MEYARFYGRRLPTEAEWEVAAAWDPTDGKHRPYPWGKQEPSEESPYLANLAFAEFGTTDEEGNFRVICAAGGSFEIDRSRFGLFATGGYGRIYRIDAGIIRTKESSQQIIGFEQRPQLFNLSRRYLLNNMTIVTAKVSRPPEPLQPLLGRCKLEVANPAKAGILPGFLLQPLVELSSVL